MLLKGLAALSDAELLAILIGSGTVGQSAVGLAQEILARADNSLHDLGRKTIHQLQHHKGIGEAKAITIAAALEIGRRRQMADLRQRPKINHAHDIFLLVQPMLADLTHEEFWLLLLNNAHEVIGRKCVSTGGMTSTIVDVRQVYRTALDSGAVKIIAAHNHPSGALEPSQSDIDLTERLVDAGDLLNIPLLDHLIVSNRGFYSFKDKGRL
jgi:DNA repair protein RadC